MAKNNQELIDLINRLNAEWGRQANRVIYRLYDLLLQGVKIDTAISAVSKEFPEVFKLDNVRAGLIEAAAYGYGIVPGVVAGEVKKEWARNLAESWDSSGMKLSEKLHGAEQKMHNMIADTVRQQMRRNAAWTDAACALYDGYEQGGDVVRAQDLPQYIKQVRKATLGDRKAIQTQKKALGNIVRLGRNGAPNKALRASYVQLVKAVQEGTEEQLEKAIQVAVNEKSRYVAERIVRTEMARAYADGFLRKAMDDEDVVAKRFKLGTRHPKFDICDLYAGADLYGLGKGVYPKNSVPKIPVHPHCLCRYVEIFMGEINMKEQDERVQAGGNEWLKNLSEARRKEVLGIKGAAAWERGEDWRSYMRSYVDFRAPESRLGNINTKDVFPDVRVGEYKYLGVCPKERIMDTLKFYENIFLPSEHENAIIIAKDGRTFYVKGREANVNINVLSDDVLQGAYMTHNHPIDQTRYSFSQFDLGEFFKHKFSVLRGFDEDFAYEIKRKPGTLSESYDEILYEFSKDAYSKVLDKNFIEGLEIDMDIDGYHLINEILAKKYKYDYRRMANGYKRG